MAPARGVPHPFSSEPCLSSGSALLLRADLLRRDARRHSEGRRGPRDDLRRADECLAVEDRHARAAQAQGTDMALRRMGAEPLSQVPLPLLLARRFDLRPSELQCASWVDRRRDRAGFAAIVDSGPEARHRRETGELAKQTDRPAHARGKLCQSEPALSGARFLHPSLQASRASRPVKRGSARIESRLLSCSNQPRWVRPWSTARIRQSSASTVFPASASMHPTL